MLPAQIFDGRRIGKKLTRVLDTEVGKGPAAVVGAVVDVKHAVFKIHCLDQFVKQIFVDAEDQGDEIDRV